MSATVSAAALGLTNDEAERLRRSGKVNIQPTRTSRTYAGIVRSNVFTRFNAIITTLAVVVLAVGHPIDAIFAAVMVANAAIGITQEWRAKRTLDRLQVLIAPTITVFRDGAAISLPPTDLVLGDVIELRTGDQVPIDGTVVETSGLELDESALTGESDAVAKSTGDEVRSGSVVVGGSAIVRADAVGDQTWIYELLMQAKEFALSASELRRGVDRILRVIGWLIIPIAALLLWSQSRDDDMDQSESLVSVVAGVVGLIPQGLVLLVSLALAVAVLRLARNHVVVQELHAVEGLARIDVLCLDKTGTLTTGEMTLDRIETVGARDNTRDDIAPDVVGEVLAALVATETAPTATLVAAAAGHAAPKWHAVAQVAFSSARKWSGATFDPGGTWMAGAPEVLLAGCEPRVRDLVRGRLAELTEDARRVVMLARSPDGLAGDELPRAIDPVALVVLTERVRPDAAETMRYFAEQHVDLKIISGDNPVTVSAVARRLGVAGAENYIDLRGVDLAEPGSDVDSLVANTTVFGRVLPRQKRELVEALQRQGRVVAMTGDGVNDIPALKQADIAIAMDTAVPATKASSQLVLLDGRFDRLPAVVAEGRRVITNMERVSALFLTKTVYSAIFAVLIGVWGASFPFLPRHMSLISETTIGLPAFALSFRSAARPYRPGYLQRVMRFALPAGAVTATIVLVGYGFVRLPLFDTTLDEARTASTIMLLAIAWWVLFVLVYPVDRVDAAVLAGVLTLATCVVATPPGRRFYAIDWPGPLVSALLGAYIVTVLVMLSVTVGVWRRVRS